MGASNGLADRNSKKIDDFWNFERFSRRPPKLSDAENDPKSDEATFVTLKTWENVEVTSFLILGNV